MLKLIHPLLAKARLHRSDEHGASSVEYGLLVFAIAAAAVVIVFLLGDVVTELFTDSCTVFESEANTGTAC